MARPLSIKARTSVPVAHTSCCAVTPGADPSRVCLPVCLPLLPLPLRQVLTFTAVVMPNQDLAFMGAIAWTAINLLMSNFMVRYNDMNQQWFSQLR